MTSNRNHSPSSPSSTLNLALLPPLPKKVLLSTQDNQNEINLKKRILELEVENKRLKQSSQTKINHLEETVSKIKTASMDSIEILENIIQSHQSKINQLEYQLSAETQKVNHLEKDRKDITDSINATIKNLEESNENQDKRHHHEIQLLLQDIVVLENVLEDKMNKEVDLQNSLKREKLWNNKLSIELKSLKYNSMSYDRFRLDTPIEEVSEEEEEDLFDDNILSHCALCEKKGHHLIHCSIITTHQQKQHT